VRIFNTAIIIFDWQKTLTVSGASTKIFCQQALWHAATNWHA
jgi:hypothetical protein